jgi:DNA-binding GntR family transcriptional regulator
LETKWNATENSISQAAAGELKKALLRRRYMNWPEKASHEPKVHVRDFVHDTLRKDIMELKLEPGRYISEKEITEMLRVSRSSIREAFVKLSQEDLIETIPQKGSFISLIDIRHVEESRFVRETLEAAIVREACDKLKAEHILLLNNNISIQELCVRENNLKRIFELDEEFHRLIFVGCGKRRTWELVQQSSTHYNRIRFLRLADNYDWQDIISQHKDIVKAISHKDPDKAEKVMREHLNRVQIEKEVLTAKYPTYFK